MASPGELVEIVASALGLETGAVAQYDRVLSEAGLRTKGGRGRSAASVTSRDAATLLIAVSGTPLAFAPMREAAKVTQSYANMPCEKRHSETADFGRVGFAAMTQLPTKFSFIDALSTLIESLAKGEGGDKWLGNVPPEKGVKHISVYLSGPCPSARIMVDTYWDASEKPKNIPFLSFWPDPLSNKQKRALGGDLHQEARFSDQALVAIANLLRGDTR